jgi:hypothetical protein
MALWKAQSKYPEATAVAMAGSMRPYRRARKASHAGVQCRVYDDVAGGPTCLSRQPTFLVSPFAKR